MQIIPQQIFLEIIKSQSHTLLYHDNWKTIGLKSSRDSLKRVILHLVIVIEHSDLSLCIELFKWYVICPFTSLPTKACVQSVVAKRSLHFINSRTIVVSLLFIYAYLDQKEWKKIGIFKLSKKNEMKK